MKAIDVPQSAAAWQLLHRDHVSEMQRRHDDVFKRVASLDAIVIHSGFAAMKNSRDDQNWPVTLTPHFVHWTPFLESPALLVIRPSTKPCLYVEKHASYWEGTGPENDCWDRASFDIVVVERLGEIALPKTHVFVGDDPTLRSKTALTGVEENHVMTLLDATRTSKTPYEIASIRRANIIALAGHKRLEDIFRTGDSVSEIALHHEYLRVTEQLESEVPYGNIVGLAEHGAILHHVHYGREKKSGVLSLLVDAGATCNGYASDITRTYVRGQSASALVFGQLIDGMTKLQQILCGKFLVGTDYQNLHNEAHELIADLLVRLKLSSATASDLVTSGATRCLFPHGLGHSLGIQVHDVGMKLRKSSQDNPYLRNTSVIAEGQVVTVEPGLYFIPALLHELKSMPVGDTFDWALVDELRKFGGIRIEDNMLATVDGPVNLTRGHC